MEDSKLCILPSGQSRGTAGRYLLRVNNGVIDARTLGFHDDGLDNAPLIAGLNTVIKSLQQVPTILFSTIIVYPVANYWFSQPLDVSNSVDIQCGNGARAANSSSVNLVFYPGVSGVRYGILNSNIYWGGLEGAAQSLVWELRPAVQATVAGSTSITAAGLSVPNALAFGALSPISANWYVGDSILMFGGLSLLDIQWEYNGQRTNRYRHGYGLVDD